MMREEEKHACTEIARQLATISVLQSYYDTDLGAFIGANICPLCLERTSVRASIERHLPSCAVILARAVDQARKLAEWEVSI